MLIKAYKLLNNPQLCWKGVEIVPLHELATEDAFRELPLHSRLITSVTITRPSDKRLKQMIYTSCEFISPINSLMMPFYFYVR